MWIPDPTEMDLEAGSKAHGSYAGTNRTGSCCKTQENYNNNNNIYNTNNTIFNIITFNCNENNNMLTTNNNIFDINTFNYNKIIIFIAQIIIIFNFILQNNYMVFLW